MIEWYPSAIKLLGNDTGSFVSGYAKKGVLHTTEGGSAAGAISAYRNANSWPHFTVETGGTVYQHIPISLAARALQNLSGGVETNRGGAIQIEVVGYASKPLWPTSQINAMRSLMRWIEAQTGIKQYGPTFGGSSQAGYNNSLQFSNSYWTNFNGWCGHQHVPENDHWDPGAINLNNLFSTVVPIPTPDPVPTPIIIEIGLEEPVKRLKDGPFSLDVNGNGWRPISVPWANFRNVHIQGSYPPVDGYWPIPKVAVQQRDTNTIIEVTDGAPNQSVILYIDYI